MDATLDSQMEDQLILREVPAQTRTQEPGSERSDDQAREDGDAAPSTSLTAALAQVGPRLRQLRQERAGTLAELSRATGISVSTLSRLESGQRRPSLELLLPVARAYQVPLDELVTELDVEDPRVQVASTRRGDLIIQPLTRRPGGVQAYRMTVPQTLTTPQPQHHDGYEWLYVLDGRLRITLADRDLVLETGEAAEFDTRLPHWFGSTGEGPVEFLALFGPQGERIHLRARSRRDNRPG